MIIRTEDFLKKINPSFSDYSIDYLADGLRYVGFYPLTDKTVKGKLNSNCLCDFVYWKAGEAIAFDIANECSHNMFMYFLYVIDYAITNKLQGRESNNIILDKYGYSYNEPSDNFVLEQHGFFLSSISDSITISEDYKMSALERRVFKGFDKKYI